MNTGASRFLCPSFDLDLKRLARKHRRLGWCCLALALSVHLAMGQVNVWTEEKGVSKPLTTKFVKRMPRLTKPLEMKKRPLPKRRSMQRKMVSVKAKVSREEPRSQVQPMELVQGVPRDPL